MKTRMLSYFFAKQKHGAQPGGSVPSPVEVLHNTSQVLPQHLTSVTVTLQLDPNCRVILYSIYDPTFGVQLQCCATLDKHYLTVLLGTFFFLF